MSFLQLKYKFYLYRCRKTDSEKLFLEVYNINPKFNLSYRNKMIYISLITDNLKKNYIYYIFDLLNVINNQISRV